MKNSKTTESPSSGRYYVAATNRNGDPVRIPIRFKPSHCDHATTICPECMEDQRGSLTVHPTRTSGGRRLTKMFIENRNGMNDILTERQIAELQALSGKLTKVRDDADARIQEINKAIAASGEARLRMHREVIAEAEALTQRNARRLKGS